MALTFQGQSLVDITSGIIVKIEIAPSTASTTWLSVGDFTPPQINVRGLTSRHEYGTDVTYALEFTFSFSIVQTKKTAELAAMAAVQGTGLYSTDVLVKFTYIDGRTLTLGDAVAAPMRVTMDYTNGSEEESQRIDVTGRTVEAITVFAAKVA